MLWSAEQLQKGLFIHLAFDGTTKHHRHILVLHAFSYVDGKPIQKFIGAVFLDGSDAATQCKAIIYMLVAAGISQCRFGSVTVDSCSTNIGGIGGIVVLLEKALSVLQGREVKLPIMHCACHIVHNALETAITQTFGADKDMKRVGQCANVCHSAERLSKKSTQWW